MTMQEYLKIHAHTTVTIRIFVRVFEQRLTQLFSLLAEGNSTAAHIEKMERMFEDCNLWADVVVDYSNNTITLALSPFGAMNNSVEFNLGTF